MKSIDINKNIFKFSKANTPTEKEIKEFFKLTGNDEYKPDPKKYESFKKEFLYLIDDYNSGGENFSKHLLPSQKIKTLLNIQHGCRLIHSNIHFHNDPELKFKFSQEYLKKTNFESKGLLKSFKAICSRFSLPYLMYSLTRSMDKYTDELIKYYEGQTKMKGNKKDIQFFIKCSLIDLFNKSTTLDKQYALEYYDQLELFLFNIINTLKIDQISRLSKQNENESKQTPLRRFIKQYSTTNTFAT